MPVDLEGFRLSHLQRSRWLLGAADARAEQVVLDLTGPWEAAGVRGALAASVARHDALRTRFVRPEGVRLPVQVIADDGALEWSEREVGGDSDLEDLAAEERRALTVSDAAEEEGAPLRALFARRSSERAALVLTASGLVADGASLRNLVGELLADAEDEPVQYLQYSEWEHSLREDEEEGPVGKERWLAEGNADPAGAPAERPTGERAAYRPEHAPVPAPEGLHRIAEALGAEVEEVVRAAWHALVARVTGDAPALLAVTLSGRKHDSLLAAVGPFARAVPVAVEIDEDDRLRDVLARQREALERAEEWMEHYAADDFLTADALPGHFPAAFEWERWETLRGEDGRELSVASRRGAGDRARLTLVGLAGDGGADPRLHLRHDASFVDAAEAALWAERLGRLLGALADRPDTPLAAVDTLAESEAAVLRDGARGPALEPAAPTLHGLFARQAAETPGRTAVTQGDRSLSYGEVESLSNRLARRLARSGVGPEDRVGVLLGRTPELVVALLGVLKTGAAYLPLDPEHPEERLRSILEATGAGVVLAERSLAVILPGDLEVVEVEPSWAVVAGVEDDSPLDDRTPTDALAYVLYTSGSTGKPKGVMVPHRGVVHYLAWSRDAYGLTGSTESAGAPVHSPLGFDLTVTALWGPLVSGGAVTLVREEEGVEGLARLLAEGDGDGEGFGLVKLTPAHLQAMAPAADGGAPKTRALVVGGEALRGEMLAPWRAAASGLRVFNEYGPTETVVGCTVHEVPAGGAPAGDVPIGRPIANARVHLLNGALRPVHPGAPGEIFVGGPGLARGYVGAADETAARLVPDPFGDEDGGRLYRTGDFARLLPSGDLLFLGRRDGQVKIRGHRVELGEVETVLGGHPELGGAVVTAREDTPGDRRLVAYVTGRDGEPPNTDELRRFLLSSLPEAMVPAVFVPLPSFPLTPNGKVDRRALPAPSEERPELDQPYVEPRTETERHLAEIWSEVLGVERVGIHDNYFALGGDSMRSVRVVALAKERDLEVTLQDLFRFRTIAKLSEALASPDRAAGAPAAPAGGAFDEDDEMARLLDEIESMSDEDARDEGDRVAETLGAGGGDDTP